MEDLEKDFSELIQRFGKLHGFDDLTSKVVALLYLEPEEIAMDKIAEKTGYSLSSISNTMKRLERMGVVQRKRKPKTKKLFFYMEKDLLKLNKKKFEAALENMILPSKEELPKIIKKYKNKDKVEMVEKYYKELSKMEKVIKEVIKKLE